MEYWCNIPSPIIPFFHYSNFPRYLFALLTLDILGTLAHFRHCAVTSTFPVPQTSGRDRILAE